MGQEHSKQSKTHDATPEELGSRLAHRFAEKCFTALELAHLKDNFRTLAETRDGIQYWKEDTLSRFLSLPDVLRSAPVVYQMASYLGAFPFSSLAPAILTREAMVKVIVLMTERYGKVLKRGLKDRNTLLFRSLAVYDRQFSPKDEKSAEMYRSDRPDSLPAADSGGVPPSRLHAAGFPADIAGMDENDDDNDELALAALDELDVMDIYKTEHASEYKTQQSQIPVDNFRQVLLLLLILAPLGVQEPLSSLADRVTDAKITSLRRIADSILWSFAPEQKSGIDFHTFTTVVDNSMPFLFEGLSPLFEHLLFSKNLDLNRHSSKSSTEQVLETPAATVEPLLQSEGEVLTVESLSQISFFLPATSLFRRLRLLYSGALAGFSINSISQKVLNWRAPSILLVSGQRLDLDNLSQHEKAFTDTLPHRTLPKSSSGNSQDQRLVFGVYINVPWKQTHKEAIGDSQTTLFQLEPMHDVFHASTINRDYVTLNLSNGIGLGLPPSKSSLGTNSGYTLVLGPVSLLLNSTLEYGVFTHDEAGGGAFSTSRSRTGSWRDVFEIDALEVWGCGGDEETAKQREAWKWEEREAAARRGLNIGSDKDATYALLEMAGIVGGSSRSGGSMA